MMEGKRCSKCEAVKSLEHFGRMASSPDGLAYYCKACKGLMNRAAYVANADARRADRRAKHAKNRAVENARQRKRYAEDPAAHRAKAATYRGEHREERRAASLEWRRRNPDYQPAYNKKYAEEHREEFAAYGRTYRDANRPKIRAYLEKYRQDNPKKMKAGGTRSALAKFGITPADFDQMLAAQAGRCLICDATQASMAKRFAVDHEHVQGYPQMPPEEKRTHIRGLLCDPCNKMIGHFKDSPALLRRAAAYVRRHEKRVRT